MSKMRKIRKPGKNDVLLGRGSAPHKHPGNRVKRHKKAFAASTIKQRGHFVKLVYNEIRSTKPPGRFLKQNPKSKLWSDIGEKEALGKTRHALRDGAPKLLKEIEAELRKAELRKAELRKAELRKADQRKAELRKADQNDNKANSKDPIKKEEMSEDALPGEQPFLDSVDLSDIFTSFSNCEPVPCLVEPSDECDSISSSPDINAMNIMLPTSPQLEVLNSELKMPFMDSQVQLLDGMLTPHHSNNHSNVTPLACPSSHLEIGTENNHMPYEECNAANFDNNYHPSLLSNLPMDRGPEEKYYDDNDDNNGEFSINWVALSEYQQQRPNIIVESLNNTVRDAALRESICETLHLVDKPGSSTSNEPMPSPAGRNDHVDKPTSCLSEDAIMVTVTPQDEV